MKLYEVLNGYTGESYVRCYVWASSPERALQLANTRHMEKYKEAISLDCVVRELFDSDAQEFSTPFDDAGWPEDWKFEP